MYIYIYILYIFTSPRSLGKLKALWAFCQVTNLFPGSAWSLCCTTRSSSLAVTTAPVQQEWAASATKIRWVKQQTRDTRVMLFFFPTCQVRIVRFYVSCPARLPPVSCLLRLLLLRLLLLRLLLRRTSTASARSQRSPPDPNSKPRIRVFPAGPELQALDRSVPRRTSTTKNLRGYTR